MRTHFNPVNEVLLTSDSRDALDMYSTGLEHEGFTVFPTASTLNAAAFLESGRPPNALVVVASLLGGEKAWTPITRLLAGAALVQVPVVLVTPSVSPDGRHRRAALRHGCAACLGEPCVPSDLCNVLRRVMAGERGIISPPLPR
jgi:CheY-like chemotaxis protein